MEITSDALSTNSTMNSINEPFHEYTFLPKYIEHLQQNDFEKKRQWGTFRIPKRVFYTVQVIWEW